MESWGFLWADERAPSQINNAAGLNIQVINSDDVKLLNIKLYLVRGINHHITLVSYQILSTRRPGYNWHNFEYCNIGICGYVVRRELNEGKKNRFLHSFSWSVFPYQKTCTKPFLAHILSSCSFFFSSLLIFSSVSCSQSVILPSQGSLPPAKEETQHAVYLWFP